MDVAKLICMLKDRSLFFARADQLGDQFEGAKGLQNMKEVYDAHYLRFFRDSIRNPPAGYKCELSEEQIEIDSRRLLEKFQGSSQTAIRSTFVSCWHESEYESEAQWRLYCPLGSAGVALCTTFGALKDSLGNDPSVTIGRVTYFDFSKNFAGPNDWVFKKRQSLSHEKEVRAVIWQPQENSAARLGLQHEIDLGGLIRKIVVSPFAPSWFENVLRDVLARYEINAQVSVSELSMLPFY